MQIKIIPNKEINFIKWDNCVRASVNSIVYAETWYLDIVCPEWQGIIADDYDIVMPICAKRKYLINYVYQPYFTQQLGLFTPHLLTIELVDYFLGFIPYNFVEMNLNTLNKVSTTFYNKMERINYELDLPPKYDILKSNYSNYTKRNLRKAIKNKLSVIKGISVASFTEFYKQMISPLVPELKKEHYLILTKIISQAIRKGKGQIISSYSAKNTLLASAFILQSSGRVILLAHAVNQEGKESGAVFTIIDKFIEENAQKAIILDFEGSNIPGIANFFAGFGATPVKYWHIKKNTLHPLIKLFKK